MWSMGFIKMFPKFVPLTSILIWILELWTRFKPKTSNCWSSLYRNISLGNIPPYKEQMECTNRKNIANLIFFCLKTNQKESHLLTNCREGLKLWQFCLYHQVSSVSPSVNAPKGLSHTNYLPHFAVYNAHFFPQTCQGKIRMHIIHG